MRANSSTAPAAESASEIRDARAGAREPLEELDGDLAAIERRYREDVDDAERQREHRDDGRRSRARSVRAASAAMYDAPMMLADWLDRLLGRSRG